MENKLLDRLIEVYFKAVNDIKPNWDILRSWDYTIERKINRGLCHASWWYSGFIIEIDAEKPVRDNFMSTLLKEYPAAKDYLFTIPINCWSTNDVINVTKKRLEVLKHLKSLNNG